MNDAVERALAEVKFDADGLVPAVAQQHDTGEILMVAWMNRDAVRVTLTEGRACYWSRSRKALWRKGETSNQIQILQGISGSIATATPFFCTVEQAGVACHTGQRNCFFRAWHNGEWVEIAQPLVAPEQLYGETPA